MDDLFPLAPGSQSGYRLEKVELYNWGAFDSTRGGVHAVKPHGATTLLIGQNGSGKSTLVDAILTLLVRPGVRNYNVAAGARKQERDERSYIKGAYGRFSRDEDNHGDVQYLRPNGRHYSAILACFRNDAASAFTLAQVLCLGGDGSVEKVYCFTPGERSIAGDLEKLQGTDRLRQQLVKRGFRATSSYTEYFGWITRATGMKPKAMDMFNQTVAVKDIQSLNHFIRGHMLESKPWQEKIDSLQSHFAQLSEAHQTLVRVRRQFDLLQPVVDVGAAYAQQATALVQAEKLLHATDSFFRQRTIDVFEPACIAKVEELKELANTKQSLEERLVETREGIRNLTNEMEQAGGARLKQLPMLIEAEAAKAKQKRLAWKRVCDAAAELGLSADIHSRESLASLHEQVPSALTALENQSRSLESDREADVIGRARLIDRRKEDEQELEALMQRQGNLPEWLASLRRRLCESLQLPEKDLPFLAELVAVRSEQRGWQSSIEMVLRPLALSLLVPARHYQLVAKYVDQTRLADATGRGQRMKYLRVGERTVPARTRPVLHSQSLLRKLDFREGQALSPWVRAEVEERFDLRCCDTVEEFQAAQDMAMTPHRHVKWRQERHEKDDRDHLADPRNFVLGWDNREKRCHLATEVEALTAEISKLDRSIAQRQEILRQIVLKGELVNQLKQVKDFADIDFALHEREKAALEHEKCALEEGNDVLRVLRSRIDYLAGIRTELECEREVAIKAEGAADRCLEEGRRLLTKAREELDRREADGSLKIHRQVFEAIDAVLVGTLLSISNLFEIESQFKTARSTEVEKLRNEIEPHRSGLVSAMNQYLREFRDDQADLDARVEYLDSFRSLHSQIQRDDLPRHEGRFKERLNEKVTQEIGLLNGAFQTERTEIRSKIDLLNHALRQLEYRHGTFMQLQPRDTRDREITDFQNSLKECLAGTFEGTLEADEARYLRIEKFLARLREEHRWREKVTDVRRWFEFAARELDARTNDEKAYYEDSTGQSGGEKAKLAFTILVAAIAYQYDIDPMRPASDRFRFVVVDEMFSKVDDQYAEYALNLFNKFGLQLLIVAPLDAKARVTEPHVGCYVHVVKDLQTSRSELLSMTAREFEETVLTPQNQLHIAGTVLP